MTKRPFILLTNDDGIQAPGLRHLWDGVRNFADVAIVAPNTEKSGSGLAITWTSPLHPREVPWEDGKTLAWSLNGTPADCIKLGVRALLPRPPDLILSGVNAGSNAGRTIFYSGTVGGVIDGVLRGIGGIAFSFFDFGTPPLGCVKSTISALTRHFLANPLPAGTFLNVTFPPKCEIKGIRMAKQGRSYWRENPDRRVHPEGQTYYWLGGQWTTHEEESDSDVALLRQGFTTVVPISIQDLTDHKLFAKHSNEISKIG